MYLFAIAVAMVIRGMASPANITTAMIRQG
jgi:hypothetical protein